MLIHRLNHDACSSSRKIRLLGQAPSAAKAEDRPLIDVVRSMEDAKVTTLAELGPSVVQQVVRQGRGQRVVSDESSE